MVKHNNAIALISKVVSKNSRKECGLLFCCLNQHRVGILIQEHR